LSHRQLAKLASLSSQTDGLPATESITVRQSFSLHLWSIPRLNPEMQSPEQANFGHWQAWLLEVR